MVKFVDKARETLGKGVWSLHFIAPGASRVIRFTTPLGEEILDFYQPDATLKVEDILPDLQIPPPDQAVEPDNHVYCANRARLSASHTAPEP